MMSLPSTSRGSDPSQKTYTAEQALQIIWDRDDNLNDLLSDDSLEHDGKEVMMMKLPTMFVNCCARLSQHIGNGTTWLAVLSKRVSVDFEHSERLC